MSFWTAANWYIENNTQYLCDHFLANGSGQDNVPEKSYLFYHRIIGIFYQGSFIDKNANTKCVLNIFIALKTEHNSKHAESY